MTKMLFLLPVPIPPEAMATFAIQIPSSLRRPDLTIDFASPGDGSFLADSPYETTVCDMTVLAAGRNAQAEGYDLVCSFTMSDSGVPALRSYLDIPVVGAGSAAFYMAAQLGRKFSVITMWEPWLDHSAKLAASTGLGHKLASVRHVNTRPDTSELLAGKEDVIFAKLEEQARLAVSEDGADVVVLGSTTMYQSYNYLAERLPFPVVNPGTAAFKMCETLLDLKLNYARAAYPKPERVRDSVFSVMAPPNRWSDPK
jgi:allantoin racemase